MYTIVLELTIIFLKTLNSHMLRSTLIVMQLIQQELIYSLTMDQHGPKHVEVNVFRNITAN